jgi:hypothetical protein
VLQLISLHLSQKSLQSLKILLRKRKKKNSLVEMIRNQQVVLEELVVD